MALEFPQTPRVFRDSVRRILPDSWILRRLVRPAWALPLGLTFLLLALIGIDPLRGQLVRSVFSQPSQYLRIHQAVLVPANFARLVCGIAFFAQLAWLFQSRLGSRLWGYALLTSSLLGALGITLWIMALQIITCVAGSSDALLGFSLIALVFAHPWAVVLSVFWWRSDVLHRCPVCLRRLQFPLQHGSRIALLLDPPATELICGSGHGALTQSCWQRTFHASRGFWQDLAES